MSSFVLRYQQNFFFQFKSTLRHCMKYGKIWRAFSDMYFPLHGQNRIRISPYMGIIYKIRKNKDTIMSIYGKLRTRESRYFKIFHPVCFVTISIIFILIWHQTELYMYVFFILIWRILALYVQYSLIRI